MAGGDRDGSTIHTPDEGKQGNRNEQGAALIMELLQRDALHV